MKTLLIAINAKYIHSNLALYSLLACSGEYKECVELGEYTINNPKDYILQGIYKSKPDVLCFSCYIWNIDYVRQIASEYKKLCPNTPIWVGGPEVSYEIEDFLSENSWCTGVIIGEGEATFRELVGYYVKKEPNQQCDTDQHLYENQQCNTNLASQNNEQSEKNVSAHSLHLLEIPGLAIRQDDEIIITPPREPMDMNDIPFCYDDITDLENRIIYYESSRGCPFSCSYCLSSIDKKLRFRNTETVKGELQFFLDKKVPQIKFVDRTFNCNHQHAYEIWKYILEHDNGVTNFHFEVSADLLNDEELELISQMRPGLIQLEIGVQSTNDDTITEIHRTMNLSKLNDTVKKIQSAGNIHEHLDLIAGLPFEDYETFAKSFDDVYALKPNQLQLGFLKVLKGSFMFEHAKEYEIVYHDSAPYEVMQTKWLSYEKVLKLKQVEEMVEVYYNSGQFDLTIKILEKLHDRAFDLYQNLGSFYEEKGYFGIGHNRIRRAEILLEYVKMIDASKLKLISEALTYDLYTRENCKTRPSWAVDASELKAMTREHCPKGKLSHVEPFSFDFPDKKVKTIEALPQKLDEKIWYLFDYENKDALDNQAMVSRVE